MNGSLGLREIFFSAGFWLLPLFLNAQITRSDYQRADSAENWNKLVYHGFVNPVWNDHSDTCWYKVQTEKEMAYYRVDARKKSKQLLFETEKLVQALNQKTGKNYKILDADVRDIHFGKTTSELTFVFDSIQWKCQLPSYKLDNLGKLKPKKDEYWNDSRDESANPPVSSPDSLWVAFIRNYNVYIRDRKTGQEYPLSFDGSEGDYYSGFIYWAPDSKHFACNKIRDNKKHYIYFVESSPKTQLQPILQKREYLKPGDALPIKRPALFDIASKKQIDIVSEAFENQFDLSDAKWEKDSHSFTFEFNQRGHQVYQIVAVDAQTGNTKIIVDERSNTFIDYSGKYFRYDTEDGSTLVWASERDGWNHLYQIDKKTGKVINQITRGEWLVRGVEQVNEKTGTIIFKASGVHPGEDPYFIHYYSIHLDGTGMKELTPEPGNHEAVFSSDFEFFVDSYSAVNIPPVTVLRNIKGESLLELERADIHALLAKGFQMPEVFVAKARDGKTDIWGNIYRPSNFNPQKSYPIIEYIYAGPQSSFVQKSFRPYHSQISGLAELGFIVVQIDGMGTSNRSKAFHDVCFKNLKDAGFPDRILWVKAAASKYSYMDTTRVGLHGTSAGGQNALGGLLFHPEFYKAGVASCGCHDNRMDKMWWNEQWMGYPIGPQYAECSNVVNAYRLQGDLLLMVGEVDDNVDPASTMQVVDALVKAGKTFDFLVLPGYNHTAGGKYGERKRRDFFVQHLLQQTPPAWNAVN